MAPVHNSSGPEPKMMFGQNSSSLVLHQMMSAQISSGLAPQCLKMLDHSSSSLGLHCQKTFDQISSNLVSQMSQRRLLASLQAPFLKDKKVVKWINVDQLVKLPVVDIKGKEVLQLYSCKDDKSTGPSVLPEDATSTRWFSETLSHADANLVVGSNSEQSHVPLAGIKP
ncbi:hypothetical protein Tco_1145798 [Tanacetum coccineum]